MIEIKIYENKTLTNTLKPETFRIVKHYSNDSKNDITLQLKNCITMFENISPIAEREYFTIDERILVTCCNEISKLVKVGIDSEKLKILLIIQKHLMPVLKAKSPVKPITQTLQEHLKDWADTIETDTGLTPTSVLVEKTGKNEFRIPGTSVILKEKI